MAPVGRQLLNIPSEGRQEDWNTAKEAEKINQIGAGQTYEHERYTHT